MPGKYNKELAGCRGIKGTRGDYGREPLNLGSGEEALHEDPRAGKQEGDKMRYGVVVGSGGRADWSVRSQSVGWLKSAQGGALSYWQQQFQDRPED